MKIQFMKTSMFFRVIRVSEVMKNELFSWDTGKTSYHMECGCTIQIPALFWHTLPHPTSSLVW